MCHSKDKRWAMLSETLEVLTRPAAAQLEYLASIDPDGLVGIAVVELALEYDDAFNAVAEFRETYPKLFERLDHLDAHFEAMSDPNGKDEWTQLALKNSEAWETIRTLAKSCVSEFRASNALR